MKKLGFVYSPDQDFVMFTEGFNIGHVNKDGFIGEDIETKKPNGTIRIALLGDSYVQGLHLFNRDHLSTILEDELKALTNKKVEVLKFWSCWS